MGTSTRVVVTPRSNDATEILDRVIVLVEEGRYAQADEAARGLSYLGLVGGIADPHIFREGALARHWSSVRRQPALIALVALLRQQIAGDIQAMDDDLVLAAATLAEHRSADPVARIGDLTLEALCLMLGSRTDDAIEVARRAATLLFDLGPELARRRKSELAPAACDLAGLFMIVDEYTMAMHLWGWVRAKVSDPSSPLLVQADVGLAGAAAIAGGRGRGRTIPLTANEHGDAPGLWHAFRLSAEAFRAMDDFDPHAALGLTRTAIGMLPDPYVLGPLVSVHVIALISVGHPHWAIDFLDALDEEGPRTANETVLGQSRLLSRVLAHSAAADTVAAAEYEALMLPDSALRRVASAYRLLWAGDPQGAVDVIESIRRHAVFPRRVAFLRVILAASHARLGMDADAVADLERFGGVAEADGMRGVSLALPRTDIARLTALAAAQGTIEMQNLLPPPATIELDVPPVVELKPRERQVLGLAAAGHTNAEIAERLFLSPNTVKYHLAHAFRALGAATREEAVATAERLGQLSDPEIHA